MKWIFLLLISLASCSSPGYHAQSAAEARAYAKRAVETGVVHKGGEATLAAEKSVGKPLEGKWDPQKIEKFVAKYAADNPRRVEINRAATKGIIGERERFALTTELDMLEAQGDIARSQQISASLNSMSASLNQSAASINQNTALINQSTVNSLNSRIYTPTYQRPAYLAPPYQTFYKY